MADLSKLSRLAPHLSTPAPRFRVASYNIRKCLGTDRRRDPERVMRVVAGLKADIVALQEVDRRLGDRPAALPATVIRAHGYHPMEIAQGGRSLGWHGNTILLREGAQVDALRRLELPGFEPRGAVAADITLAAQGLRAVGLHLGLRPADRRRQISALLDWLAALPPRPTVIMGDFNIWGRGPSLPGHTMIMPGRSYHSRWRLAPLDRIAHGPELLPLSIGIADKGEVRHASDHLPIWADFALS